MELHISGGQITKPTTIFPTHAFDRIQAVGCLKKPSDRSDIGFLSVAGKLIRSNHTSILLQHKRFRGVNAPTIPHSQILSSHALGIRNPDAQNVSAVKTQGLPSGVSPRRSHPRLQLLIMRGVFIGKLL
ncbi:hypothetical protein Pla52n_59120 [Stieleria varia]|uniref:Uncharacterized protein n=1 Tax=Stieleria varia TaxID=2528005 RepID=A0A5C6A0A6_9BACT|nr:hypothetical protein Pla52n_59120 [Stieleria varia]